MLQCFILRYRGRTVPRILASSHCGVLFFTLVGFTFNFFFTVRLGSPYKNRGKGLSEKHAEHESWEPGQGVLPSCSSYVDYLPLPHAAIQLGPLAGLLSLLPSPAQRPLSGLLCFCQALGPWGMVGKVSVWGNSLDCRTTILSKR